MDVSAAAIGDASSLQGGLLLLTSLKASDGQVYAVAQGPVVTGGFVAGRSGTSQTVNHPTVGRLPNGAIIEREAPSVTQVEEKPPRGSATTRWNNAGILALSPLIFDYARRLDPSERGEFELPQAIARMVADGLDLRACPVRGFWSDVGTPDDLQRADAFAASGELE
jgi:hypothetical protein